MTQQEFKFLDLDGLLYYDGTVESRLGEKADEADIPTAVSELQNDSGYQANVIETVQVNGTALTPSSKSVNVLVPTTVAQLTDSGDYAKKTDLVGGMHYMGTVQSYSNLPQSGMVNGDMYNIATADSTHGIAAGDNVVWNSTSNSWDVQRGDVDMSAFVEESELVPITNAEIDAIVNGTSS